jgi:type IV pilus assembly protein PilA
VGDKATQAQKTSRSSGGFGAAKRRSSLRSGSASRGVGWHVRCSTLYVKRGFTLIELMIVVAIIGTLAAIAIPNFLKFQCRAKQSEVKALLGSIRIAEEAYFVEYSIYVNIPETGPVLFVPNEIGFAPKGARVRYSYRVDGATTVDYLATGSSSDVGTGDTWTADSLPVLRNTVIGCG